MLTQDPTHQGTHFAFSSDEDFGCDSLHTPLPIKVYSERPEITRPTLKPPPSPPRRSRPFIPVSAYSTPYRPFISCTLATHSHIPLI